MAELFEHNLAAAKQKMLDEAAKGSSCPCCGGYVKLYKRKLNSQMVDFLSALYRHTALTGEEWHHVRDFLKAGAKASSDGTYLRHWGFIEPMPKAEAPEPEEEKKKQRTSGYWKITDQGKCFVEGLVSAASHVLILNGRVQGFTEQRVNIWDAAGEKFDYDELMKGIDVSTGGGR